MLVVMFGQAQATRATAPNMALRLPFHLRRAARLSASSSSTPRHRSSLFVGATAPLAATTSTSLIAPTTATATLEIYPNPVTDKFVLTINNELTGAVNVQIYNMQGALAKQFTLSKSDATSSQFYLSIGELSAANYIVKVTMTGWTASQQISKQ